MNEKQTIEQLFQKEFESFEVRPSAKVWRRVRYDLFIKNFFRFSLRNFNVYYAAGIIVVASVIFFSLNRPNASINRNESVQIPAENANSPDRYNVSSDSGSVAETLNSKSRSTRIFKWKTPNGESKNQNAAKPPSITATPNQSEAGLSDDKYGLSPVSEKPITLEKYNSTTYNGQSVVAWFDCISPEGCTPLKTSFRNFSQNAVRFSWSFGDGGGSELENPSYIFDEPGTWFVSLTAFSASNEISIYTDSIKVNPSPEARFSMDIQGLTSEGLPVYFYNYSSGSANYLWDFGDGSTSGLKEPDHYFTKKSKTNIKLLALSAEGCRDSIILKDAFKEGEPVFIFPTAFSPNTNGPGTGHYTRKDPANNIFYPYVEEEPEEYQLKVFTRNGLPIFESNDISIGWDGYYHEQLQPQGVYVWKARAVFSDGRSVVRMGDVTVLWGGDR